MLPIVYGEESRMGSLGKDSRDNPAVSHASAVSAITDAQGYFAGLNEAFRLLPLDIIDEIVVQLLRAYEANRTVFVFGNGGSASLASHMACDLGKGTSIAGMRRLRVMSLADN